MTIGNSKKISSIFILYFVDHLSNTEYYLVSIIRILTYPTPIAFTEALRPK